MLWIALSSVALAFSLALTWWLHRHHRFGVEVTPAGAVLGGHGPPVSLVVPARNEARHIRRCVEALLAQSYPNLELIVVDDRSTDATPALLAELAAAHPRLRLVPGLPLPAGWAGKPHALVQGVAAASPHAEWLCFVDADTFAHPSLVAAALAAAQVHQADLLSLFTYQELGTFWEKVVLPIVFSALAVGFPPARVNDPRRPDAVANGQFILIRRAAYAAVGGHAALFNSIIEDKALAENVKRAGFRLLLADGRRLARTRMYTSLADLWQGWTKNIYLGLERRRGLLLLGAGVSLAGALALPIWLLAGLAGLWAGGGAGAVVVVAQALLAWSCVVAARAEVARALGLSGAYGLTLPLGALLFAGMLFDSTLRALSGRGVHWKGRVYGRETV